MSTFVETSKIRKRNLENPPEIYIESHGKPLRKSHGNFIESLPQSWRHFFTPRYWFLPTWHLFLVIFHHFRPKFAPELIPMPSFGLPWAPLGLIWGTFWIPLNPLWRPLASLLPCQDTSWGQSWSFSTPKSDFGRIFHEFSMFSKWNFVIFCIIFTYFLWRFHFVISNMLGRILACGNLHVINATTSLSFGLVNSAFFSLLSPRFNTVRFPTLQSIMQPMDLAK